MISNVGDARPRAVTGALEPLPAAPHLGMDVDFYDGVPFADRDFKLLWSVDKADVAEDVQQALALRLPNSARTAGSCRSAARRVGP